MNIRPTTSPEALAVIEQPVTAECTIVDPASTTPRTVTPRLAVIYAVAAYSAWGLVPIYFNAVAHVGPLEVLAHRILWSVVFLLPFIWLGRRWSEVWQALRSRRVLLTLCLTTLLIAGNWGIFIYSVVSHQVIQASLGYFINPLINVLLGFVFLRERLRPWQAVSVVLASIGVLAFVLANNALPGIALVLAFSFGFYGLLRKTAPVEGLAGLLIETTILSPVALIYLMYLGAVGQRAFASGDLGLDFLLALAGVVTALPLLWFAIAARRLRLTTMGFLQYLAPTGHFLCAMYFGETFTWGHAVTFAFIWVALAVYSADSVAAAKRRQPQ